jgi:hypothetical protein
MQGTTRVSLSVQCLPSLFAGAKAIKKNTEKETMSTSRVDLLLARFSPRPPTSRRSLPDDVLHYPQTQALTLP